jgi:tRNA A37 threonylcarbamoyladenosine modification protein TsaB
MILFIDTTDFSKIIFAISDEKKVRQKSFVVDPHKSHETLEKLEEFLLKSKIVNLNIKPLSGSPHALGRETIKKIYVNKGPGSYTGTRIGVTIGQALGMAWDVPVKFIAKDKFEIK